jgi:hypothetical protein
MKYITLGFPNWLVSFAVLTKNETPSWFWVVIGCSIALILIAFGITSFITFVLWKKRNVFIMKIVRIFQPPETDGKEYVTKIM